MMIPSSFYRKVMVSSGSSAWTRGGRSGTTRSWHLLASAATGQATPAQVGVVPVVHQQQRTMAKKSKKKPSSSSGTGAAVEGGRDKNLELIIAALDAPETVEPTVPADEMARRYEVGRNYVIGRFREHNEIHHDLACKIQMKKHAVRMLPRNYLKDEAMKIDNEGPPPWRHIATWTPPIPNFSPEDFLTESEQQ